MPCNSCLHPQRSQTSWRLHNSCSNNRSLLVAYPCHQCRMVCEDLPFMPASPNMQYTHSTSCCHPHTSICEDVYGYNAPSEVQWFQIFGPGPLLAHALSQILHSLHQDHEDHWQLDIWWYSLPMGHSLWDHHGQWPHLHKNPWLFGQVLPHSAHSNLGV